MRVCLMCQEDIVKPQGGTGTYVRNVSIALATRGHDVHVISRRRDDAPSCERVDGVLVHRVAAPGPPVLYSPLYFQQSKRKFVELHRAGRFDVVQGNLPLMSSRGLRLPGLPPVVETVHCTLGQQLAGLAHRSLRSLNPNEILTRVLAPALLHQERAVMLRAQAVIAVGEGLKRELVERNGYPAERIGVIPNGVDCRRFTPEAAATRDTVRRALGIAVDERVIMYLGRLMEGKRAIDLVRALPAVLRRIPNARLVIVGRRNRYALRIERAARELGVERKVALVDHVPYRDVPSYYAMADLYALPSAHEGFPFTVIEAMAAGTPVVASDIPGIDEQIVSGRTGLLHPAGDVDALARCLLQILGGEELAARLARAARRVVEEHYDWAVIGARTERVLARAAGARLARTPARASA